MTATMERIRVSSWRELVNQVSRRGELVSPPGPHRTNEHREWWTLAKALRAYRVLDRDMPIALEHRDAPDFILQICGANVGIEVTELVPPNLAKARVIAEQNRIHAYCPRPFRYGTPSLSASEIDDLLRDGAPDSSYLGDEPEAELADLLNAAIRKKTSKLCEHYDQYDLNVLLLYENTSLPALDLGRAIRIYAENHTGVTDGSDFFDRTYLLSDGNVARLPAMQKR